MSNKGPSGVWVSEVARRSYTDSIVESKGQGLGFSPSASEGVFPKKSLQWTIELVNGG